MDKQQRVIRITKRRVVSTGNAPTLRELPYVFITFMSFAGASALSYVITNEWRAALAVGLFSAAVSLHLFFHQALPLLYQKDVNEEVHDVEPLDEPIDPNAKYVRIMVSDNTAMELAQPEANAFRHWALAAMTQRKVYFSKTQAESRGFDYTVVITNMIAHGLLHSTADGNDVHQLTNKGRRVLSSWLGLDKSKM